MDKQKKHEERRSRSLKVDLSDQEVEALCRIVGMADVSVEEVVTNMIRDLIDGNGVKEQMDLQAWFCDRHKKEDECPSFSSYVVERGLEDEILNRNAEIEWMLGRLRHEKDIRKRYKLDDQIQKLQRKVEDYYVEYLQETGNMATEWGEEIGRLKSWKEMYKGLKAGAG